MFKKTKGVITAGHIQTARAAERILREGGNAFDAAIAALFTSFVTESCMSSAGGGAFFNLSSAAGNKIVIDAFCQTPLKKAIGTEPDFYPLIVDFGDTQEEFQMGMGSVCPPGAIAGIYYLHEHFGTLPMKILIEPAIETAREGALIDDFQYYDLSILTGMLLKSERAREIYFKDDTLYKEGDYLRFEHMADFMEILAIEGKDLFYRGEIATQIDRDSKHAGGFIRKEDLESYQVVIRQPLSFQYKDKIIRTNPLPSTGGSLVAIALRQLSKTPVLPEFHSMQHTRTLLGILDLMDKAASDHNILMQQLELFSLLPNHSGPSSVQYSGGTTHFNILDEHRNAIAVTSSNGEGSGYMIPETDIMLNNMLGEAALLPNGYHSWQENVRLSSMMMPTLVDDKDGHVNYILGSGGAGRIPRVIFQVLHYLIDYDLSLREAIIAPRAHYNKGIFSLEPGIIPIDNGPEKPNETIHFDQNSMFFGGVHTLGIKHGVMSGAADERRSGVKIAVT